MNPEVLRLIGLSAKEVASMSRPTLAKAVNLLGKSVRASMQYFAKSGEPSPTYLQWEKAGKPTFATKGLSQGQLQGLFKQARIFRTQETSTKEGFQKWQKETFEELENPPRNVEREFWELFNSLIDEATAAGMSPSELKLMIAQTQEAYPDKTVAEQREILRKKITGKYEEYQRAELEKQKESGSWWNWDDEEKTYNPGDLPF